MNTQRKKVKKGFTLPFLTRKQEQKQRKQLLRKKARAAVKVNKGVTDATRT